MKELAPGVHRLEVPLGRRRNSVHLVVGDESVLLFDAGVAGQLRELLAPALRSIGRSMDDLRHVVLSHCDIDHWGGAGDVRDLAPGAVFACHLDEQALIEDADEAFARRYQEFASAHAIGWSDEYRELQRRRARPVEIGWPLRGGEQIDLGGRIIDVLHVPGHSPGHLAVWDASTRTIISGDAVLGTSIFDLDDQPVMPPNYRHPAAYRATCARLAALDAELLLAAHFPPLRTAEAAAFLSTSSAYTDLVDAALADALDRARHATTRELGVALQDRLGPWPPPLGDFGLAAMIVGHLEEWVEQRRATERVRDDGTIEWMLAL